MKREQGIQQLELEFSTVGYSNEAVNYSFLRSDYWVVQRATGQEKAENIVN
jgi:hypothetical protein